MNNRLEILLRCTQPPVTGMFKHSIQAYSMLSWMTSLTGVVSW